jgi:sterol desaturase/sphingolipid hydroxylase (fatty acid hydroxylase superfamily)
MIGIPLAFATSAAFEWWAHKHVLHGKGKKKESFWSFHFHEHHGASRRNGMLDDDYHRSPLRWNAQGKEVLALTLMALPVAALLPVAPFWSLTSLYCAQRYYRVHKRAHLDPEWARTHLPWHYDHHMGPDQDCNWGVTTAWFDELMGTRVPYAGTAREEADRSRRAARAAGKAAPATAEAEAMRTADDRAA